MGKLQSNKVQGIYKIYTLYKLLTLTRDNKACVLQLLSPFSPSWSPGITPLSVGRHCPLAATSRGWLGPCEQPSEGRSADNPWLEGAEGGS